MSPELRQYQLLLHQLLEQRKRGPVADEDEDSFAAELAAARQQVPPRERHIANELMAKEARPNGNGNGIGGGRGNKKKEQP